MQFSLKAILIVLLSSCLWSCQNESTEQGDGAYKIDRALAKGSKEVKLDIVLSQVLWRGHRIALDGNRHRGSVKLESGNFLLKDGTLVGGKFAIDLNSLAVSDQEPGKGKERLEGHLKGADFFEVERYPTAQFEIADLIAIDSISGANHLVKGNLTIKGITKPIEFPARIMIQGKVVSAVSLPFEINRTEWGVNYGSGLLGTIQDKIISDMIKLTVQARGELD